MERKTKLVRKTKETDINIKLNLDGVGDYNITTSIGFFDHLLTQIAIHGLFDMNIIAEGDLDVDNHHIIEDTAIVLGKAFFKALGSKSGIMRVGHCFFPMDDSLAFVVVDISSRPYFIKDIKWINQFLGSKEENLIPVDLIEHFLYTFSINAQITLHVRVLYGQNNHHIAEAIFKALGKALDYASRIDSKRNLRIPSSKGIL
ncbi:MAG: imidazoleglycerol-phosphate dehydratase HisB [Promethearchaeota archaeon]